MVWMVSCSMTNHEESDITTFESLIIITPVEVLGQNSRELHFICQTEKEYPCVNYPILTNKIIDENGIFVTFEGVKETDFCFTAIGPATATLDLGSKSNGRYHLELNTKVQRNVGNLMISDSEFILDFMDQNGIVISRKATKRVPNYIYWGTIGYHIESSIDQVEEFIEKLKIEGAIFDKQTPGDYHYYQIDQEGQIVVNRENSGYWFLESFIFSFDGFEEDFNENILSLSKEYFPDLYININTFKGEQIFNWGN